MIKAIIFDFDGVLVESVNIKTKAFAKLFESKGSDIVKMVIDYHLSNLGISRFEKFRYIYKKILKMPLTNTDFDLLCQRFSGLVSKETIMAPYVKGAKEFLENHASRYRCFILSAIPQEEIDEIVRQRGIGRFFIGIYGAPLEKSKAIRDIINKDGLAPIDVLCVGDSLTEYNAAKENSVNFVARINGDGTRLLQLDCPKIKDLSELPKVIKAL